MLDGRRARTDAWMNALGFDERLVDGQRAVGVFARVVGSMTAEEFDQWRFGRMLDRNYLRNRFGIDGHV
jgi:hypothetical protein